MPVCAVLRIREADGRVPFDLWVARLTSAGKPHDLVAVPKIMAALQRLADVGHELRRPTSAPLRDGIFELRVSVGRVNYRVLYFFAGPTIAVLSHGCTKERVVDSIEVDRAVSRRKAYLASPPLHTASAP